MITASFDAPSVAALSEGEGAPLRLSGQLVPYGAASLPSSTDGKQYRFSGPPDNDPVGVVVIREHDDSAPIGLLSAGESADDGLDVTADLLQTSMGRDSHVEAGAGVRRGFSAGFEVLESEEAEDGVIDVAAWELLHVGHVRHPAFESAMAVAASTQAPNEESQEGADMPDTETIEAAEPTPARVALATTAARLPTVAEYGYAMLGAARGDAAALATLARYQQTVALAAGDTFVTNIPGVIPAPILGPVIDARPYDRPLFNALGAAAGPSSGASWTHPVVSDPLADAVAIAEGASANDTLGVTGVPVAWTAIKRSTFVSREAQIYSEPSIMGIIGEQLARAYARGCEVIAANALTSHSGGNTAIVLALNGADTVGKIVGGSVVIYGQTGSPADLLVVNPTDYAKMSGWTATDGRPLLPVGGIGQVVNAGGTVGGAQSFTGNIAGIPVIVSWALVSGQNYLIASDYVRSYEGNRATISVESGTFGVTLGVFGTVAAKPLVAKAVTPVSISATLMADEASSRRK